MAKGRRNRGRRRFSKRIVARPAPSKRKDETTVTTTTTTTTTS